MTNWSKGHNLDNNKISETYFCNNELCLTYINQSILIRNAMCLAWVSYLPVNLEAKNNRSFQMNPEYANVQDPFSSTITTSFQKKLTAYDVVGHIPREIY